MSLARLMASMDFIADSWADWALAPALCAAAEALPASRAASSAAWALLFAWSAGGF